MGHIARMNEGKLSNTILRQATVMGSAMASFTVERFSVERLKELKRDEIAKRYKQFKSLTHFDDLADSDLS